MSFNLDDYVTVAERIELFREKHPDGSLQAELVELTDSRVTVKASAFRTPDDPRPGVAHSSLSIPGTTPYTRGSELENAETSAFGRAIVAVLAADTKRGVASQDEVRKHQADSPAVQAHKVQAKTENPAAQAQAAQPKTEKPAPSPSDDVLSGTFTVTGVYGPNEHGFTDLRVSETEHKFSTKKPELLGGAAAGDTILLRWKERTNGRYVNRYIDSVEVLTAVGAVVNSDIPF